MIVDRGIIISGVLIIQLSCELCSTNTYITDKYLNPMPNSFRSNLLSQYSIFKVNM